MMNVRMMNVRMMVGGAADHTLPVTVALVRTVAGVAQSGGGRASVSSRSGRGLPLTVGLR
jgi:hypothetical protein